MSATVGGTFVNIDHSAGFASHSDLKANGNAQFNNPAPAAGTIGDLLALRAQVRGAAGIVTDGAFRDTPAIRAIDLPTYAAGHSPHVSTLVHHPQEMNVPIGCGGVAVLPGDLLEGGLHGRAGLGPAEVGVGLDGQEVDEVVGGGGGHDGRLRAGVSHLPLA